MIIFVKKGPTFLRLYYMHIAIFLFHFKKKVFISDRLEAKTKITLTWHVQNEWTNERMNLQAMFQRWNEYPL